MNDPVGCLSRRGVQPVWLALSTSRAEPVAFMPFGVDPHFYTPLETASMYRIKSKGKDVEKYFFDSGVDPTILPGQVRKGFVFTHVDEGTKAFNVDLIGENTSWHQTFFIPVPVLKVDHYDIDFAALYPEDEMRELRKLQAIAHVERQELGASR